MRKNIIEILSNGEERPLSTPNVQQRLETVAIHLTDLANWLERMAKNSPSFATALTEYKKTNELREEVLNIVNIGILVDEFYKFNTDEWQKFNAEYIKEGK